VGAPKKQPSDAARSLLRQARLRCTPARVAVLEHIRAVGGPRTHAEVADALADRGFDRATIYRNLTELTEAKIFSRVELGDHVWRFEMRHGGVAEHPHFLCTSCGEVSCLDDVDVAITPKPGAKPAGRSVKKTDVTGNRRRGIRSVSEVLLKGTCEQCD
jgi:Fur family ferric uptake transcriptional regulator